jgi:hypothetical protein
MNIIERFYKYVDKECSEFFDCWEWIGGKDRWGYGRFGINGRPTLAHRFMYELEIGVIPEGMLVLHECDNPACVNPDHLKLGTYKDNSDDKVKKDRQPKGEKNGKSKLTEYDVEEIRNLWLSGFDVGYIAGLKNISIPNAYLVVNRKTWRVVK